MLLLLPLLPIILFLLGSFCVYAQACITNNDCLGTTGCCNASTALCQTIMTPVCSGLNDSQCTPILCNYSCFQWVCLTGKLGFPCNLTQTSPGCTPSPTNAPTPPTLPPPPSVMNEALLIFVIVFVIAMLLLILLIFCILRRRRLAARVEQPEYSVL
jgi:hypothetical protein